ncbi:hypothetical protein L914_18988 [Phytophthora nicotianae]|uniref:RxLR effector protein n=2 Tax=Phytophthora nicotianae TaxID=4792 RepID=V9E4U1_PHYNI|nr:hypothetical protein F443_19754 [Phytophthora nicotianae P1569]ETM33815.1 hypothetical protein L914_18988 [Phytophthora nicotianae]
MWIARRIRFPVAKDPYAATKTTKTARKRRVEVFTPEKLEKMLGDINYAYKKFAKWSKRGWNSNDVYDDVSYKLYEKYWEYRKIAGHAS